MLNLFYTGTYCAWHSEINPSNVKEKLKDDFRSRLVDNIDDVIYGNEGVVTKNPNVRYIGGFYYENPEGEFKSETEKVVVAELKQISWCDVLVANLTTHSAIGSIAELFYAASLGKHIHIFIEDVDSAFDVTGEYWFPIYTLQRMNGHVTIHKVKSEDEIYDFIMNLKTEDIWK